MKIVNVSALPMSAPVPEEKRHRTDLGTKVKSDATLIRVETDSGLTGIGAALGTPPIVAAIVEHELAAECVDEDPMFSERIYEKMYNGSRSRPALEQGRRNPTIVTLYELATALGVSHTELVRSAEDV
jgi:D-galactarolactone cycloisomerase